VYVKGTNDTHTLWTRTDVGSISIVPMISGGSRMALMDTNRMQKVDQVANK
jgi:hypothetical protein